MSHFATIVIGNDHDAQLAPFHEFECTGVNDQYVQDVNVTDEAWKKYAEDTTAKVRDPDGVVYGDNDDRFYRDWTPAEIEEHGMGSPGNRRPSIGTGGGRGIFYCSKDWGDGQGHRSKVHEIPVEWEKFDEDTSKSKTFAEFVVYYYGYEIAEGEDAINTEGDHKFGYCLVDEAGDVVRAVERTNPNKHWDWYVVGGRWAGYFKLKDGAKGTIGESGAFGNEAEPNTADHVRKGDIDFEAMRDAAEKEAAEFFDDFADLFEGVTEFPSWDEVRDRHESEARAKASEGEGISSAYIDGARSEYNEHPLVVAIQERAREKDHRLWGLTHKDRFCNGDRAAVLSRARMTAISSFAVVFQGQWYEKGDMGWWGVVSDEKKPKDWFAEFNKLLDSVDDDTMLTLVDCHT